MNKKNRILLYIVLTFFCLPPVCGQDVSGKFKVVIDAGHGGSDPGCHGRRLKEKDVTLAVALKLGRLINDNCPNVEVIYTRKTDVFVELYRRAEIANNSHADLFISLHCNASTNHAADGIETYVMGLHKSAANQAVARAENAAMLKEKDYRNNYGGFDPNSPEANIAFSLYSSAYLQNSILLADKVQKSLVAGTRLPNRGVKQAGFWVLYKVAMPSILIEQGFLSNTREETYLGSPENQNRIAAAIYNAFASYLTAVTREKQPVLDIGVPDAPSAAAAEAAELPTAGNRDPDAGGAEDGSPTQPSAAPATTGNGNTSPVRDLHFKIQIMATPKKIALNDRMFNGLADVGRYRENNLWKYTAGDLPTHEEAAALLPEIRSKFADAFIIAFCKGKKLTEKEALEMSGGKE